MRGAIRRQTMTRRQKDPLRPLTEEERTALERLSQAQSAPAVQVIRAKLLLAVANGMSYSDAARSVGRHSNDAVSRLVSHFNQEGLAALELRHGGGPAVEYGPAECERILAEVRRAPDRERDGTATWSLTTLQHALRTAPDGLPTVSTTTILVVLHDSGYTWQRDRTWCETGSVMRVRKDGPQQVTDPDADAKKR
jgi:transposase